MKKKYRIYYEDTTVYSTIVEAESYEAARQIAGNEDITAFEVDQTGEEGEWKERPNSDEVLENGNWEEASDRIIIK